MPFAGIVMQPLEERDVSHRSTVSHNGTVAGSTTGPSPGMANASTKGVVSGLAEIAPLFLKCGEISPPPFRSVRIPVGWK
jgi:hypothetical protein